MGTIPSNLLFGWGSQPLLLGPGRQGGAIRMSSWTTIHISGLYQCQEFPDGSAHLSFTDPNTGASITVPRTPGPSRRSRPHCSHEDF